MSDVGRLIEYQGRPALRYERRLPAPIERVWRAVSEEQEMQAWFPARVVGERRVGAPLSFPFDEAQAPTFGGEVVAWEPPRLFAFTWQDSLLRIELSPTAEGTELVFIQTIPDRSEAARTGAGWQACLDALALHLGAPAGPERGWDELFGVYLDRMGPPPARLEDGRLVFERTHHLEPDDLRAAVGLWAGLGDAVVDIEAAAHGSNYRVRVPPSDAEEAARRHADLIAFDVHAASGRRIAVDHRRFVEAYRGLLG